MAVVLLIMSGLLVASLLVAISVGVEPIALSAVLDPTTTDHSILFTIRLPRVLLAAITGMGLSVSGVTLQALLGNPLADPYVLGISAGAAIGATLALLGGLPAVLGPVPAALVGSLAAVAFVYRLARVREQVIPSVALLAGVVINTSSGALILALTLLARPLEVQAVLTWLAGSIPSLAYGRLAMLGGASAIGLGILLWQAPAMNALSFGEENAHGLGVEVGRSRRLLFLGAAMLTGATVAETGPIGFVGIVVPHALRLVLGPDHRLLVPGAALGGAAFLSLCDWASRMTFVALGSEAPVGVLTALLGGPFFLVLLWRKRATQLI